MKAYSKLGISYTPFDYVRIVLAEVPTGKTADVSFRVKVKPIYNRKEQVMIW